MEELICMDRSQRLFEDSRKVLVGGVNSPVRAMKPYPFFVERAEGCRLYDADGRSYIDYCLGYGPLILGHANPAVVDAVAAQLEKGTLYGAPTELEIDFARKIAKHVPSAEMVRFVNTGTEATMGAIRLARGVTGKNRFVKFEGAFHGAHDYVLVKAGSGATTQGVPNSAGIPADTTKNTILAPFNDEEAIERIVEEEDDLACIILEPIIGNIGCVMPKPGYLRFLRKITKEHEVLLIFDEVITGFRLGLGGAQGYYGVKPDITTLGKILGGGLPIGCIASTRDVMEHMAPVGEVYQAGTFNGNPLSMTAGLAAIGELERPGVYEALEKTGGYMRKGLRDISEDLGIDTRVYGVASMYQMYFTGEEVTDYQSALRADKELFLRYQQELLKKGVFLPPSQYECNFISTAHREEDIERTLVEMESALRTVL
ncbi:MAG: glutamate-1-semialdehyde-2,1-aminomutase [Methanobacteriota archaeon]|nr:MAG: glutamate-1-semialdehyde-2,1-aminomutase [Euryarchaeota archaeon]